MTKQVKLGKYGIFVCDKCKLVFGSSELDTNDKYHLCNYCKKKVI